MPVVAAEARPIRARRTRFDLSETPLHWVPGDPQTTHTVNVLHLLLPPGERWFCDVYREALPLVTDERLRQDMRGFIGQEATHARAHDLGVEYLAAHGIDLRREVAFADRVREQADRARRRLPPRVRRRVLVVELAGVAAIEHFTGVLGDWVIDAPELDAIGADPVMVDLLRWHGAEEVEHRAVAFDAYQHLSGNYPRRVVAMGMAFVGVTAVWIGVTNQLMRMDPSRPGRPHWRNFARAGRDGRLPSFPSLVRSIPRYLRPSHHPSEIGSTERALAYLEESPGVQRGKAVA